LKDLAWLDSIRGADSTRQAFVEFLKDVRGRPRRFGQALVALHQNVWRARGHEDCWIQTDGRRFSVRRDLRGTSRQQQRREWDMRWSICHKLIRQTSWSPR
jgi:hypothetical protein